MPDVDRWKIQIMLIYRTTNEYRFAERPPFSSLRTLSYTGILLSRLFKEVKCLKQSFYIFHLKVKNAVFCTLNFLFFVLPCLRSITTLSSVAHRSGSSAEQCRAVQCCAVLCRAACCAVLAISYMSGLFRRSAIQQ